MIKKNLWDSKQRDFILVSLLLIVSLVTGCENNLMENGRVKPDKEFDVIKEYENVQADIDKNSILSMNQMGLDIFKQMSMTNQESNQLFSPTSLAFALAMLQNGAEGETKEEILKVLLEDEKNMNQRYNVLMNYLSSLDSVKDSDENGLKLNIANSLWIKDGVKPKQAFVDTLNEYYKAQVFQKDFSHSETIKQMNLWVEEQSNKLLKDTIKDLKSETVALLMNTIYFKGTWQSGFIDNQTKKDAFYTSKTKSSFIDTMHKTTSLPYFEDKLCQMTSLSYYGGSSLFIILPKEDLDICLSSLDSQTLDKISEYMKNKEETIKLSLPKLDIEVNNDLKDVLTTQGMTQVFSPSEANFQAMIESKNENMYVDKIYQNTRLILDEKGTEATAVSVVEVDESEEMTPKEPIIFQCNKPFIYLIRDDKSGVILFVGLVREP